MNQRILPLHTWHEARGADFMSEGGLLIPRAYTQVRAEYNALRQGTVLADFCHLTRIRVEGRNAAEFLNILLTCDVHNIPPGASDTAFLCNDRGGIIDILRVYRDPQFWLLIGSAHAHQRTLEWLDDHAAEARAEHRLAIHDVTEPQGHIALFGPLAETLIRRAAYGQPFSIARGEGALLTIGAAKTLVLRRDQRPLDGYDLITGAIHIQNVWERIEEIVRTTGGIAVGHGTLELLRVESGEPRVGRDIDEDTTPLEINQSQRVHFQKRQFLGRRALMHSTVGEFSRTLVVLRIDGDARIERGDPVAFERTPAGTITSIVESPTLQTRIALAFVNSIVSIRGTKLSVIGSEDEDAPAEIIRPPV